MMHPAKNWNFLMEIGEHVTLTACLLLWQVQPNREPSPSPTSLTGSTLPRPLHESSGVVILNGKQMSTARAANAMAGISKSFGSLGWRLKSRV